MVVKQWGEPTGITISESYEMTEAMPVTYNNYIRYVIGSVGHSVLGVEIQVRDTAGKRLEQGREGEICIRGPIVMKGYLNNPEETQYAFWEGGWYRSDDIGRFNYKLPNKTGGFFGFPFRRFFILEILVDII